MSTAPYAPADTPPIARALAVRVVGRWMSTHGTTVRTTKSFPDAGPLTFRSLPLRADRQPAGWHHDNERTCGPVSNERVGEVRESQANHERRGRSPEPVQEVQDRIAL